MLQFEALLEHEHLLGERIFKCGTAIAARIEKMKAKKNGDTGRMPLTGKAALAAIRAPK